MSGWDEPAGENGGWDEPAPAAADNGGWDEPAPAAADNGGWDEPAPAAADNGGWDEPAPAAADNDGGWDNAGGDNDNGGGWDNAGGDNGGGDDGAWNNDGADNGGDGGDAADRLAGRNPGDPYDFDTIKIDEVDWSKEQLEDAVGYDDNEESSDTDDDEAFAWDEDTLRKFRNSHKMTVTSKDPSAPIPNPIISFEQSRFPADLIKGMTDAGFRAPTPIQMQAWPMIMTNKDVIGVAQTGSGKTLAFALPGVMHVRNNARRKQDYQPQVIIQAPTRELAQQIAEEVKRFGGGVQVGESWGGEGRRGQQYQMQRADFIVGTPGRTQDHLASGSFDLKACTYCVLDEADRMLDMGFKPQIWKIFKCIRPRGRQMLMFSATWPYEVLELANEFFSQDWLRVTIGAVNDSVANMNITQKFEIVRGIGDKDEALRKHLQSPEFKGKKCLVFVAKRSDADEICHKIRCMRIPSAALHGGRDQKDRFLIMRDFKESSNIHVVVATGVAERGLHVDDIACVINYDMPQNIEEYVHRIGRTGRQGKKGVAITFFDLRRDERLIEPMKKNLELAKQEIPPEFADGFAENDRYNSYRGGGGGGGGICFAWQKGNCDRGDSCKFKHEGGDDNGGGYGGGGYGGANNAEDDQWGAAPNDGGNDDGWGNAGNGGGGDGW